MPRRTLLLSLVLALALVACSGATPGTKVAPPTPTMPRNGLPTGAAPPIPPPTARPHAPRVPLPRPVRNLPYTVPASCPVSPMAGEIRRTFPAWWLDGDGLAAGNPFGVYYVGENKVQWQPNQMGSYDRNDDISASGTRLDGAAPPLRLDNPANIGAGYSSGVVFPAPGCWHLHGAVGAQTLDAVVYVFPDGCAPAGTHTGPAMFACASPAIPAPTDCAITQPPMPAHTPPTAVSAGQQLGTAAFWYGNDALWVSLRRDGVLLQNDKMVWWHIIPGSLAVEGRRLDTPAPPLNARIPPGYDDMNFQATGLDFPTPGCWEVVGRLAGHELRFVVQVVPDVARTASPASG